MAVLRCQAEAERIGEDHAGYGQRADRLLLLPEPRWEGAEPIPELQTTERWGPLLGTARANGWKAHLVRAPGGGAPDPVTIAGPVAVHCPDTMGVVADGWDGTAVGETLGGRRWLVCTHGAKDACCGLIGRRVAVPLVVALPGQVLEVTHVSGDRFAGNVLEVPSGRLYGRVGPADVERFAAIVGAGQVAYEWLRGGVGLTALEQAGEVFARRALDHRGPLVAAVAGPASGDGTPVEVTMADPDATATVVVRRDHLAEDARPSGCDPGGPRQTWTPVRVDPR